VGLIIDSSAIVTLEREGREWTELLSAHANEPVALPAIVWAELLVGVRLAKSVRVAAQRRAKLEQLRLHLPILDFTAKIAEVYADIFSECSRSGTMVPQNDMAVAATARSLGYGVLVSKRDEKHFRSVKKLRVVPLS